MWDCNAPSWIWANARAGYDHRIIDGADADQFHVAVREYLENFNEDIGLGRMQMKAIAAELGMAGSYVFRRFRLGINAFGQLR